jgi:hypothetical protein
MFLASPNYGIEVLVREFSRLPCQFLSVGSVADILRLPSNNFG